MLWWYGYSTSHLFYHPSSSTPRSKTPFGLSLPKRKNGPVIITINPQKGFPAYRVPSGQITILSRPTPTEWLLRWDASTISPPPSPSQPGAAALLEDPESARDGAG